MADHLHTELLLQQLGHEADLFGHDIGRKLDQVGVRRVVVARQRLDRRAAPCVQVHADLARIARDHIAAETDEFGDMAIS